MNVRYAFLLPALLLIASGCDSINDRTEAERIEGNWSVTKVTDQEGDRTAELAALGALQVDFDGENYAFRARPGGGASQTLLSGTYVVETVLDQIVLQAQIQGEARPVPLTYVLIEDTGLLLTFRADLFKLAFPQLNFVGAVDFSLAKS